jgi:hypothetical protein
MRVLGFLLIAIGTVLIVLSFLWAYVFPPENRWTQEQAEEHARAGTYLHKLAHPGSHAHLKGQTHSHDHSEVNQVELEAARLRWQESKAALNDAQNRSQATAGWLRYSGAALAVLGVAGLVLNKKRVARNGPKQNNA